MTTRRSGTPFCVAYNTNGLAFHRIGDALQLIAAAGYDGVALTPDVGQLDLLALDSRDVHEVRDLLQELELDVAIETGARFVLDPAHKHRPNLMDPSADGRTRRVDYYRRAIDLASEVGARVVSLWSGAPYDVDVTLDDHPGHPLGDRLAEGLERVLDHAANTGVRIAFEPEPGMFVERPIGFDAVVDALGERGAELGLTLDLGHCVVTGDLPIRSLLDRYGARLLHVHVADCPAGVHEHLPLGAGDLDLGEALGALEHAGFTGMAAVELSRDSHRAPEAVAHSLRAIRCAGA